MNSRLMLIFAAMSGLLFVALGAFGAHVLSHRLGNAEMAWIHTGLEYQGFHTLVILVLAVATQVPFMACSRSAPWFSYSALWMAIGILLFSGSLYALALTQANMWVYLTPLGGSCFLVGWILLLIGALRLKREASHHE